MIGKEPKLNGQRFQMFAHKLPLLFQGLQYIHIDVIPGPPFTLTNPHVPSGCAHQIDLFALAAP